jgi:hypothetical protein
MAMNLIVLGVTLLMGAFVAIWIFVPRLRSWMELPKYRFLEQQRKHPDVLRDGQLGPEEPSPQDEPRKRPR